MDRLTSGYIFMENRNTMKLRHILTTLNRLQQSGIIVQAERQAFHMLSNNISRRTESDITWPIFQEAKRDSFLIDRFTQHLKLKFNARIGFLPKTTTITRPIGLGLMLFGALQYMNSETDTDKVTSVITGLIGAKVASIGLFSNKKTDADNPDTPNDPTQVDDALIRTIMSRLESAGFDNKFMLTAISQGQSCYELFRDLSHFSDDNLIEIGNRWKNKHKRSLRKDLNNTTCNFGFSFNRSKVNDTNNYLKTITSRLTTLKVA